MSRELVDSFGRKIDYLRLSVTDRCSLRCVYCMPKAEACTYFSSEELLSTQEWIRFVQGAALVGIRKVRLTGGEPLMRADLTELVSGIHRIPGIQKVVMTTNGIGLADRICELKQAGLAGVNLSLDTLDAGEYQKLSGRNALHQALEALEACLREEIPVKINCVPVGNLNRSQWIPLARLAAERPVQVRYIEMMPIGGGKTFEPVENEQIRREIENVFGPLSPVETGREQGPASIYTGKGFAGSIGFISAVRHGACAVCGRIRATADGKLKLCLHHPPEGDIRRLIRAGADPEEIANWLKQLVKRKPQNGLNTDENRPMWRIGG